MCARKFILAAIPFVPFLRDALLGKGFSRKTVAYFVPRAATTLGTAILIALLLVTPAFAATMNTYASQFGGNQFIQMNPGDLPSLTDTFAGTAFQSTYPNALIFVTSLLPTGSFTISFSLTIGGQQFNISGTPCTTPGVCNVCADFTMPTFYRPTKGTLVVHVEWRVDEF